MSDLMTKEGVDTDPINEEGEPDTYGCACTFRDSYQCAYAQSGRAVDRCSCLCHGWRDEDARKAQ